MLVLSYRTEERIETAIELALEITGRSDARGLLLGMQSLERLLKLREVDLHHAERALAVKDAHEQKFLRAGGCAGHEYPPFRSSVVHLVEGLAIELASQLTRRSVDGGREGADGHHIGRVGEAELSDRAATRIEENTRDETCVVFQPRERSRDQASATVGSLMNFLGLRSSSRVSLVPG